MKSVCAAVVIGSSLPTAAGVGLRRAGGPLDGPDRTGYDPVEVLCALGKDGEGKPKIQGWCKDWIGCIKEKATPQQDKAAVMKAWSPAECKEICGVYPQTTPLEGGGALLQKTNATSATALTSKLLGMVDSEASKDACLKSCGKFQDNLSNCVSKILFEPGQISAMGLGAGGKTPPSHCTLKDTPCTPDLPVRSQQCWRHKTREVLYDAKVPGDIEKECKMIKSDMETCKDCPSLSSTGASEYLAFSGGCMDQLNAYFAASHPDAKEAALPGATGCQVHA